MCKVENIEKYCENIRKKRGWLACKVENIGKILRNIGETLGKRQVGKCAWLKLLISAVLSPLAE